MTAFCCYSLIFPWFPPLLNVFKVNTVSGQMGLPEILTLNSQFMETQKKKKNSIWKQHLVRGNYVKMKPLGSFQHGLTVPREGKLLRCLQREGVMKTPRSWQPASQERQEADPSLRVLRRNPTSAAPWSPASASKTRRE